MAEQIDTLGDALPREIARVRDEVLPAYLEIGEPGQFAAAMIRATLDQASKAMVEGDVVGMLACYYILERFDT